MRENETIGNIGGMNDTPAAERTVIGFFGRRNVGKSSVVNAVTSQRLAVVSEVKGTTTDPVQKAMELLPLGPVLIIDTPGIDDSGPLGEKRVRQTRKVLNKADVAVLVVDAIEGVTEAEKDFVELLEAKRIPYIIARNKSDLLPQDSRALASAGENNLAVSAATGSGISELKELIARSFRADDAKLPLVSDILSAGDLVVLVVPIDKAAPKGRLILPQQQVIRGVLEAEGVAIVTKENGLRDALAALNKKPRIVICDSQVFAKVSADTPPEILLTSFSILFARHKGSLAQSVRDVRALGNLKDGDRVLICEGCTHHRQCDDIGTVKLPKWIREFTRAKPAFEFASGGDFPDCLANYKLIIHCGACMLNDREMKYRLAQARDAGVPMTNYGVLIAHVHGALERALLAFEGQ
jgi:[FeFe] hydrogenase H-cluster maturation GTPase HydF